MHRLPTYIQTTLFQKTNVVLNNIVNRNNIMIIAECFVFQIVQYWYLSIHIGYNEYKR